MRYSYIVIILIIALALQVEAQQNREQKPGKPLKSKNMSVLLQGTVYNESTGQTVPNADITVKEASRKQVLAKTKANAGGFFEVEVPKGIDLEVKAQAPNLFYDAFKTRISTEDTTSVVVHDFNLPSELRLRLNFPTNKYDNPYPFILDEEGNETTTRWQQAIEQVAEDLIKYKDYISKVIITGHTDSDGSENANIKLGENRALFLMNELQKNGVPASIMEVRSAGESELLEKKPGEDQNVWKKRCRRVVISREMKK